MPNIQKLKAKRNIKGLIKALGYKKEASVRQEAAGALASLGWIPDKDSTGARFWIEKGRWDKCAGIGEPAVKPLIAVLKDKKSKDDKRRGAASALGQIGEARAVGPLISVLDSDTETARIEAAKSLGQIGDVRAIEPLASFLKEETVPWIRETAVEALAQIDNLQALKPLTEFFQESPDSWVLELADNLGKTYDKEPKKAPFKELFWVLKSRWDHLVEMGAEAMPLLETVIKSPAAPYYKKEGAAEALVQADKDSGVELLIALLKNQDWQVRGAALYGLQNSEWAPGSDLERAALWIASGEAARLKELDYKAIKPLLIESMDWQMSPDDWYVKGYIAKLLVHCKPPPDPSILKLADEELEKHAKKYSELFDHMVQNPKRTTDRANKRVRTMFQDYADLITAATSYKESSSGDGGGGRFYSHDTDSSLKAVKDLCKITTPVSTNLLHHLSRLKDMTVTSRTFEVPYDLEHGNGMGSKTETLSFESQRSAAIKELICRGNPDYDFSVFKAEGCWSLPKE